MRNILVGAGGWAYFQVPGQDSLRAYSSTFDFVEVNNTYYEYPNIRTVSGWRSRVPRKFEFSVRCNREIVDAFRAGEARQVEAAMEKMREICKILDANILAILVPAGSSVGEDQLSTGLEQAVAAFGLRSTRIAVELRDGASTKVFRTMKENDAIHCVDLSKEQPAYESGILYSRLFGKGKDNVYQFDDEEIREIAGRATAPKFEKSILAFHGVRMFSDTARLRAFLKSRTFLKVTGQTGLDSLGEVLKEDTAFPSTKTELVAKQGWKLFDLTEETRVRAESLLSKLPDGTYSSLDEVKASLQSQFPREAQASTTTHAKSQHSS